MTTADENIRYLHDKVESLTKELVRTQRQRDTFAREHADAMETLRTVKECLGEDFIGLPAREVDIKLKGDKRYSSRFQMKNGDTAHTMAVTVEKHYHPQSLHCRVQLADATYQYAISQDALWATPPEALIKRIAHEISYSLVNILREDFMP